MNKTIDEKISSSIRIALAGFVFFILTLILGIIFLFISFNNSDLLSVILFSIAGVTLLIFLFFEYRFRSLLKYRSIQQGIASENTGLDDPRKEIKIDKEELFRQNRKGSYFRNVKRYLYRDKLS